MTLGFEVATTGYAPLSAHTLALYRRWDHIVEPAPRVTRLTVTGGRAGARYSWRIARSGAEAQTLHGDVADFTFHPVTAEFSIELIEAVGASTSYSLALQMV